MNGKRTALVLGAGASYCYEDGTASIPTQVDIIGRLFQGADTSTGEGFPGFVGPSGMTHSFQLGQFLRQRFGILETGEPMAKLDFWSKLQAQGFTLETLYDKLEAELSAAQPNLLREFEAILRTAINTPIPARNAEHVCRYHRLLCEALEPGDYVVSFNWDSLMADALLFHSHFWFPHSGFGFLAHLLLAEGQKSAPISSLVHLFQVHGSVLLYEPVDGGFRNAAVYFGPEQYNEMSALTAILGMDMRKPASERVATRQATEEEQEYAAIGYAFLEQRWFRPIFVTPSKSKASGSSKYMERVRRGIHSLLPNTEQIVVAGYSFPDADLEHLRKLFPTSVLSVELNLTVVNPENAKEEFRKRVQLIFPSAKNIDFSCSDFRVFARDNATLWSRQMRPELFTQVPVAGERRE